MPRYRFELWSFVVVLLLLHSTPSFAQLPTGTPVFGTFGGGPDIVNLDDLNVHIDIPVLNKAGRMIPFVYKLGYDSSNWYVVKSGDVSNWQPVSATLANPVPGLVSNTSTASDCQSTINHQEYPEYFTYTNWTYKDPGGTLHPFAGSTIQENNPCLKKSSSLAATATDGSGYTLSVTGDGVGWKVMSTDGTVIHGDLVEDRNGNEISTPFYQFAGPYTDTTGSNVVTTAIATLPGPTTITYTAPNAKPAAFTINYGTYTVRTNFGCTGINEFGPTTEYLVSNITLPDSTAYTFTYESTPDYSGDVTGRLKSVTFTTGGQITYGYSGGNNGIICGTGGAATMTRTVSPGGEWTYAHTVSGTASETVVTDPLQNQTVLNFQDGFEIERQIYSGSDSGSPLFSVLTCYNGVTSNCQDVTSVVAPVTQLTRFVEWGAAGGVSGTETNLLFNSRGLPTEVDEYGYNQGALPLIRKTLTTYSPLGNGIVDRPAQVTVQDGSGNVKSQTTYSYDQTAVVATTSTPQQVAISGSRGNATTIGYFVNSSTTLSKTAVYFDTGNTQAITDVNGAQTTYSNNFACGNSFPTAVTEPLGLSVSLTWNCTGGTETSFKDENGQTQSRSFSTDPDFWRPNSQSDPIPNVTSITYTGQTSVESNLPVNGSTSILDIRDTVDGLGREEVSQIKESSSSSTYDSIETGYDSLGRPNRLTLAYGGTASQTNSTGAAISTTYDPVNRVTLKSDSGGGNISVTYTKNDSYQTVNPAPGGENAKRKQLEYDGLGRLTSICEITSGTGSGACSQTNPATGFFTTYSYDALNDLTSVTQNAQSAQTQTRTFSYDGLRRLTSETNPESGTTAYTYDTDTNCGNSQGDLVKKIDAVGNTSCYAYDARHRIIGITYSGPYSSSTPNKHFVYDAATVNGVAMANANTRMAEAYTCTSACTSKITDIGLSYTVRGQTSDVYESTPNSGGYYHVSQTYWPNGVLDVLSAQYGAGSITGLPIFTYGLDGEGRSSTVTASAGQNPLTGTTYNVASLATQVNLGSTDSDSFTYDPNTNRMEKYTFTVNGQSVVGTLNWNASGTLGSLAITDPFYGAGNQTCSYVHEDLSRISSANCGSAWSQTFSYDVFGNIMKSGTISFLPTYSYLTNRITQVGSSNPTYDANGNATNDTAHTYTWDANGKAVTVDSVGLTYDALGRMVEQNKGGSNYQIVYTPMNKKFAIMKGATLQMAFVPLTGGSHAVYTSSGLTYYRHSDWIGSSRFASTPTRTMYSDGAYAPFGESYLQTGTADVSFTGMNQDTVANLYDFPAREYNDIHGRWPSPDPLGLWAFNPSDPQTLNRYVYVRNSPQENTDPAGLCVGNTGGPAEKNTGKCRYSPNPDALAKNWSEPIWGNDVFDALEGAPGTFMYTDMRGNVGFGWDYSLYIATESEMAQLSQLTDNTQPSSPTGPDIPLPPIPQAFFAVTIEYNGTDTLTSGFVPELISSLTQQILDVGAFAQAYSKVAGNPAAQQQVMNEWAPYLEYDVEASARVWNTFFGLFD